MQSQGGQLLQNQPEKAEEENNEAKRQILKKTLAYKQIALKQFHFH